MADIHESVPTSEDENGFTTVDEAEAKKHIKFNQLCEYYGCADMDEYYREKCEDHCRQQAGLED